MMMITMIRGCDICSMGVILYIMLHKVMLSKMMMMIVMMFQSCDMWSMGLVLYIMLYKMMMMMLQSCDM